VLVKTDDTALRLKPFERLERTRAEQADAIRQKIQKDEASIPKDGLMDVTSGLDRLGKPMFTQQFVKTLKKLNPKLHYEVSIKDPSIGGIYFIRPRPLDDSGELRQFICRCEVNIMPEYQIFKPKTVEHPDPTIYRHYQTTNTVDSMVWGYRTVLARLIRGGFLTQSQVDKAFGLPTKDSEKWQRSVGNTLQ